MSRRAKVEDSSYAVGGCVSYGISSQGGAEWPYLLGSVPTPFGYVEVYSQGGRDPHTSYRVIFDGRCYVRIERGARTRRGLAVQAGKFAREIYERLP